MRSCLNDEKTHLWNEEYLFIKRLALISMYCIIATILWSMWLNQGLPTFTCQTTPTNLFSYFMGSVTQPYCALVTIVSVKPLF